MPPDLDTHACACYYHQKEQLVISYVAAMSEMGRVECDVVVKMYVFYLYSLEMGSSCYHPVPPSQLKSPVSNPD